MSAPAGRRNWSPSLGLAAVATTGAELVYVRLLSQQGDWPGPDGRQSFVIGLLAAVAVAAAIGAVRQSTVVRVAAAAATAASLLPLGLLSLFSIGIIVLIAGALAAAAWAVAAAESPRGSALVPSAVGAIIAVAVVVVGFAVT